MNIFENFLPTSVIQATKPYFLNSPVIVIINTVFCSHCKTLLNASDMIRGKIKKISPGTQLYIFNLRNFGDKITIDNIALPSALHKYCKSWAPMIIFVPEFIWEQERNEVTGLHYGVNILNGIWTDNSLENTGVYKGPLVDVFTTWFQDAISNPDYELLCDNYLKNLVYRSKYQIFPIPSIIPPVTNLRKSNPSSYQHFPKVITIVLGIIGVLVISSIFL